MKPQKHDNSPVSAEAPTEVEIRADDLEGQSSAIREDDEERLLRVRRAAYAKYQQRGYVPGHEEEDWLEAEREIDSATGDTTRGDGGLSS